MRRLFATLLCTAQALHSLAQDSARVTLPATEITATRLQLFSVGLRSSRLDSTVLQRAGSHSLADVLQQQLPVYFKNYSPGSLATANLRGTAAAHTGVVWNGIVLNSALNSTLDLSLLPAAAVDAAEVQWGGAGAHYGSGLVGGSILMRTTAAAKRSVQLGTGLGSLGLWQLQGRVDVPLGPLRTTTRAYTHNSRNDFLFANTAQLGAPTERLRHAAMQGWGVVHSTQMTLGNGHSIEAHVWWQQNQRELPSSMSDLLPGRALQRDQNLRAVLQYAAGRGASRWLVRAASVLDALHYQTDESSPARNDSRQWGVVAEAEWRRQLHPHWLLNLGLHQARYQGWADGYRQGVVQQRWAGFAAVRYQHNQLTADLSLRQENTDNNWLPPIPLLGVRWQGLPWLAVRGAASLSYRVPTLNERYWQPGGNPDLLAEQGYNIEGGLHVHHQWGRQTVEWQLGGYTSQVSNWVQWLPGAQGYYSPRNIQQVHLLGTEHQLRWRWQAAHRLLQVQLQYHYTSSHIIASVSADEVGKPLPYTPAHVLHAQLLLRHRGWQLAYQHPLVGQRYTDHSSTSPLPAYDLGHVQLSYTYTLGLHTLDLQAGVSNIYDQAYQNQRWYAMPGRQYTLSLRYHIF